MDGIHDSIVANNQFVVGLNLDIYSFAKVTNITGKRNWKPFRKADTMIAQECFGKQRHLRIH